MNQQSGSLPLLPASGPPGLSWSQTWIKALTQPSVAIFEQIASDAPIGSNAKSYTWIFVSASIASAITVFGASFIPRTQTFQGTNFGSILTLSPLLGLICVPIMAVIAVFYFVTIVGITHLIARAVGGTGTYSQLLYTSAAISAPAWIINGFLGLIPVVPYLTIPLGIYVLVLDVMAVKAVHQFGWGQALLSSFGIWVLLLIFVAAITIGILGRASRP